MTVYDEVLKREEKVQEEVTPENGREIILTEPEKFADIFAQKEGDEDGISE